MIRDRRDFMVIPRLFDVLVRPDNAIEDECIITQRGLYG